MFLTEWAGKANVCVKEMLNKEKSFMYKNKEYYICSVLLNYYTIKQ